MSQTDDRDEPLPEQDRECNLYYENGRYILQTKDSDRTDGEYVMAKPSITWPKEDWQ